MNPYVGIDIVDLGLIKDIIVLDEDRLEVDMVLTSQACPLVGHLTEQVRRCVEGLYGIREVEVKVLDEPWNWDRFTRSHDLQNRKQEEIAITTYRQQLSSRLERQKRHEDG